MQVIFDSLIRGSQLALLAVGLTMVYDVLRFPSFAHTEFGMVGAFIAFSVSVVLPVPPYWALVIGAVVAFVFVGVLGLASDRIIFARLRNSSPVILMIASFGLGIVLHYGTQAIWGASARSYELPLVRPWVIFGGRLTPAGAAIIVVAIASMVAFHLLLTRTTLGIAMRATADNSQLAGASGIFTERIVRIVWFIGAALAAIGGVMLAAATQLQSNMGFMIMLPVFAAAVLGGIGNVYGAVLGGYILGFAENVGLAINWAPLAHVVGITTQDQVYIPVAFKAGIAFGIFILILLIRPQGLLGMRHK